MLLKCKFNQRMWFFIYYLVIYQETFDNTIDDIDKYSNSMALLWLPFGHASISNCGTSNVYFDIRDSIECDGI